MSAGAAQGPLDADVNFLNYIAKIMVARGEPENAATLRRIASALGEREAGITLTVEQAREACRECCEIAFEQGMSRRRLNSPADATTNVTTDWKLVIDRTIAAATGRGTK